ncbi:MAG TPA: hypothetical protein VLI55_01680 [Bryobacteraceae bacterium]|nr:hypothetical protein [Bryobacteraceae bacterium]
MESDSNRSAVDNIKQLRDAGKELLDAGNQITENLGELSERVERAKSVGAEVATSPWFIAGGAILAGLLVLAFSHHR